MTINDWYIYTRHCPVCEQGLCRVRRYTHNNHVAYFLLCDECNTVWNSPDDMRPTPQPDPALPKCPTCDLGVFAEGTAWATLIETIDAGWYGRVYIQRQVHDQRSV